MNQVSLALELPKERNKSGKKLGPKNSVRKTANFRGSALAKPRAGNNGFSNLPRASSTNLSVKNINVKSQIAQPSYQLPNDLFEYFSNSASPRPFMSFDDLFDEMVEAMQSHPINEAIEIFAQNFFKSDLTVLWYKQEKCFFSPSFKKTVDCDGGIIGNVAENQNYTSSNFQENHIHFKSEIDTAVIPANYSVLVMSLHAPDQPTKFVLQLGRDPNKRHFDDKDFTNVAILQSKLKIYGSILLDQHTALYESSHLIITNYASHDLCVKLKKYFKCDRAEFWCYKVTNNQLFVVREETTINTGDLINTTEVGAVRQCLFDKKVLNEIHISNSKYYNKDYDGDPDAPALGLFNISDDSNTIWAVILRGHKTPYSIISESILSAVFPFAIRALQFVVSPPQIDAQLDHFEQRLKALLEVAEILSGVLDLDILLPTIMDRACKLLNAERCSLFLVDNAKHELVTRFHGGLDSAIHLKIGRGIVGSCAESGEIVNIRDAYADQRFDRSVDLATGFTTRSLLCIPIYNNRGEITGVTEMINKKDEGLFDEDDEKMLMAFNVFCGISLDNARLYKASLDLTRQLRSFIQMSVALNNNTETLQQTLEEIMNNIRNIVNASRVTIFLNNENDNTLYEHLSIGDPSPYGTMFAQEVAQNRKFMLFDHKEVLGRAQTQQLNQAIERILAAGLDADLMVFGGDQYEYEEEEEEMYEDPNDQNGMIFNPEQPAISARQSANLTHKSQVETNQQSTAQSIRAPRASNLMSMARTDQVQLENDQSKENTEVICGLPMLSSESTVLGVIELSCNWKVMSEDIKLFDCFSVFAAVSIERSQLKDRAKFGQVDFEMKTWISDKEKNQKGHIPAKLLISMNKLSQILMIKFDASKWEGIGHIKVIFAIFDIFDLMNTFNITNEKLFKFLFEIRNTYNKVPYHNWRHAVDVTQFTTYQILAGGLDMTLTKFEIFGIIVSAICHDADHDGFTNVYNVKAETPLGILFKNQSVMETHHCSVAINIISKDEFNLFACLSSADNKNMWTLIINLILSTDMAKHFDILKEFNSIFDNGKFTLDDPHCRTLLLELLLKGSDVSNVSRPFELADKWCDVLCEEFFRQGDLEKANGMEFTSALNDREHLDKPKSQIGFYQFVCLPLFEAIAKAVPKLYCNVQQVSSNLEQWKAAKAEEKENEE